MNIQNGILVPFIGYFVIMITIGALSFRFSSKGISEYFLGGRQMNRFVVALSAVVSGRSAWLLLGVTGLAYKIGLSAIWAILGYTIVEFFLFLVYAPRLRKFTEENDCITIPDFFVVRFKDKNNILRILIVVIFLIFMIAYIASQFVAGGKAFNAYFNISTNTGLLITAIIVLIYTLLGGFLAVSLTDVLQAIVMITVLILLPVFTISQLGGLQAVLLKLSKVSTGYTNIFDIETLTLIGFLGIGLGSPGNPHILVRYMSIKDPDQFKVTALVGTIWNFIMGFSAIMIGLVGRVYFPDQGVLPGGDEENIYITLANHIFNPFLTGLLLASVFAAIMSTADSQLLVAASAVVRDIYQKIIEKKKHISQKQLTFYSKITVTIIVVIAIFLGIKVEKVVFWFVLFAWAGLGSAIGPTSILALFSGKVTKTGIIVGILSGTICVFIWKLIPVLSNSVYELIPGFIIAFLFTILFSSIK